jgi:hypothetical protein
MIPALLPRSTSIGFTLHSVVLLVVFFTTTPRAAARQRAGVADIDATCFRNYCTTFTATSPSPTARAPRAPVPAALRRASRSCTLPVHLVHHLVHLLQSHHPTARGCQGREVILSSALLMTLSSHTHRGRARGDRANPSRAQAAVQVLASLKFRTRTSVGGCRRARHAKSGNAARTVGSADEQLKRHSTSALSFKHSARARYRRPFARSRPMPSRWTTAHLQPLDRGAC